MYDDFGALRLQSGGDLRSALGLSLGFLVFFALSFNAMRQHFQAGAKYLPVTAALGWDRTRLVDVVCIRPVVPLPGSALSGCRDNAGGPTAEAGDCTDVSALTEEQKAQIREIFKKNEERMRAYRTESRARLGELRKMLKDEIDAVLTPEQRAKNDEMIRRFEEWRKKDAERNPTRDRREPEPPPPPVREK